MLQVNMFAHTMKVLTLRKQQNPNKVGNEDAELASFSIITYVKQLLIYITNCIIRINNSFDFM